MYVTYVYMCVWDRMYMYVCDLTCTCTCMYGTYMYMYIWDLHIHDVCDLCVHVCMGPTCTCITS